MDKRSPIIPSPPKALDPASDLRETLKQHLQTLAQCENDPLEFQVRLIQMAAELNWAIEDCRHLWEQYRLKRRKSNKSRSWLGKGGKAIELARNNIVFFGQFSLFLGVILFFAEADKRQIESRHQAWQVINRVPAQDKTSAGRIEALQQLNLGCAEVSQTHSLWNPFQWSFWREFPPTRGFYAHCISLNGLAVPGVQLAGIDLEGARLQKGNFQGTFLEGGNFRSADLTGANFEQAQLPQANFNRANLTNTRFKNANLQQSDLRDSILIGAQLAAAELDSADLRGADLTDAKLDNTTLQSAVYDCQTLPFQVLFDWVMAQRGAYFIDANPSRCLAQTERRHKNLTFARLSNAQLQGMDLSGYDLSRANLQVADLKQANLFGANLTRANLQGTDLSGASLRQANLQHAIYDAQTQLPRGDRDRFQQAAYRIGPNADLARAQLQSADLRNTDLRGAKLMQAQLQGADLREANLADADLTDANVSGTLYDIKTAIPAPFKTLFEQQAYRIDVGASLERAKLSRADLQAANLISAKLRFADLKGANLVQSRLNSADLSHASLEEADLRQADLEGVNLSGASLKGANLERTNLSRAIGLSLNQLREAQNWEKAILASPNE